MKCSLPQETLMLAVFFFFFGGGGGDTILNKIYPTCLICNLCEGLLVNVVEYRFQCLSPGFTVTKWCQRGEKKWTVTFPQGDLFSLRLNWYYHRGQTGIRIVTEIDLITLHYLFICCCFFLCGDLTLPSQDHITFVSGDRMLSCVGGDKEI